ncbi:hypothetical protein PM3016_155 [Paenibacillus mucilaginosus 3016]|uniref:DUF4340 domain-containing protein n=1 Tax=Paenibacillus mucilaginosus 3016 TaxID=1116391 RepID=H6NTJ0_9BACL|nr:DUF4340 domain-containing protein [Paenibacillus mucilaginosus]AFC27137.1 hypothetical protein PM3016_155 [Paenibacillus mucilaginosus 3016]WFA16066.1 DUF4340 domain-containing protein [Paenibacillus mucilaginosus]
MKRLIPTLVLVLLCIGGFWYASSKDFFKEKPPETPALVTVSKQDVTGYTIKNGDTVVEMAQKDGKWTMTKPSALPLNDYEPGAWVDSFTNAKKEKTVDANPSDLAQFGLAQPNQEFTVTLKDGTKHTLSVGDPVAVQGFYYAKFGSSPEVFQLAEMHVTSLAKQPLDFMEKSPVKLNYEAVRSIAVDYKGGKWTLTKAETDKKSYEANWKLGDQEVKGADASAYLDKVSFLTTDQPAKASAEVKGLDQPDLRLEVKEADAEGKETAALYTGKLDGANVWIAKQGDAWAFSVPAASVQELADLPKTKAAEGAAAGDAAAPAPAAPQDAAKEQK